MGSTSQTLMKFCTDMYHQGVDFSFPKKMGVAGAYPKNHQKMSQNSRTFHFNFTSKQFEKRYEGRVFFTVFLNHLTLVMSNIGGDGRAPTPFQEHNYDFEKAQTN